MATNDGIKISDKRATHDDDEDRPSAREPGKSVPGSAPTQAGAPPHPSDSPEAPVPEGEAAFGPEDEQPLSLLELNFFEITNFCLGLLIQKAWIALGLVGNPATGRLERDPAEARRLIDLISLIAGHMQGKWGHPDLEQELQTQLTNLRLNFAKLPPTP